MKQRILKLLKWFMWIMIVLFAADTVYRIVEYRKFPEMYAAQSAPWYTEIIFFGIVTVVIVLLCLLLRWIVGKRDD